MIKDVTTKGLRKNPITIAVSPFNKFFPIIIPKTRIENKIIGSYKHERHAVNELQLLLLLVVSSVSFFFVALSLDDGERDVSLLVVVATGAGSASFCSIFSFLAGDGEVPTADFLPLDVEGFLHIFI